MLTRLQGVQEANIWQMGRQERETKLPCLEVAQAAPGNRDGNKRQERTFGFLPCCWLTRGI